MVVETVAMEPYADSRRCVDMFVSALTWYVRWPASDSIGLPVLVWRAPEGVGELVERSQRVINAAWEKNISKSFDKTVVTGLPIAHFRLYSP